MECNLNSQPVRVISQSTVFPSEKSAMEALKLSVSDLPMLSCHYIERGALFLLPPDIEDLSSHLISGLSKALSLYPPLAGRLFTDASSGEIFISCNDAGAHFIVASAPSVSVLDIDVADAPPVVKEFFSLNGEINFAGHFLPILAVQSTILSDGVFIGCSANHAVVDGTCFWNFFNTFADMCREGVSSRAPPLFDRVNSVLFSSTAVIMLPPGGPPLPLRVDQPVKQRIFSFSRSALLRLKANANNNNNNNERNVVVSTFQALCALLWRCVTRARQLSPERTTTFKIPVNCRHRVEPPLHPHYFGNAIQFLRAEATVGEILSNDLKWCGELLWKIVTAHDNGAVRRTITTWEKNPNCFQVGNFDGATISMGSSPRFPAYEGDFGWGKPVAVRSGRANKYDGKMSAFPGPNGGVSIDVDVVLFPNTMAALQADPELLHYLDSS